MFLLIDNYDSFTYNLVQTFYALGQDPVVIRNDDPNLLDLASDPALEMVCISPGPGHPSSAGLCLDFLKRLPARIPVLGVCLGHQILGLHAGAKVVVGPEIMHGKQSDIAHDGTGLFRGLPSPLKVGRYHSLVVVSEEDQPDPAFTVTARGPLGEVMALHYNDRPWVGVQFHPESVLTPDGMRLLANFPHAIMAAEDGLGDGHTGIRNILECLARKQDLTADLAATGFGLLLDGKMSPAQAGSFLTGLRMKGETALELGHAMRAAQARSIRIDGIPSPSIDIVGTGGDGRHSFNCSTTSALILAAMGHLVVKHGNRAVSSTCGAADALEALGFTLEKEPAGVVAMAKRHNFAFAFAPHFHPSFRHIGPVRRELGIRTLFNILGPMINPAHPSHLLMGVARPELVPLVAETLRQSSLYRAAVVHGAGGYDEVTPIGPAQITLIHDGKLIPLPLDPADFGIAPCTPEDLAVHSREDAIAVLYKVLDGTAPRPMLDMVTLNIGLALYLLEVSPDMKTCMKKARDAVISGIGKRSLPNA